MNLKYHTSVAQNRSRMRNIVSAIAISIFVVAGNAVLLAVRVATGSTALVVLLWLAYTIALLTALLKIVPTELGCSIFITVFLISLFAFGVAYLAREESLLAARGEHKEVTVTEQRKKVVSKSTEWHLTLRDKSGQLLPGPEMRSHDRIQIGASLRVIYDPRGEISPRKVDDIDTRLEIGTYVGSMGICSAIIFWGLLRRHTQRHDKKQRSSAAPSETDEMRLREVLRARDFDRRGYIRVSPSDFPSMTHAQAASVAQSEGLLTEVFGNNGFWRFGDIVVERFDLG